MRGGVPGALGAAALAAATLAAAAPPLPCGVSGLARPGSVDAPGGRVEGSLAALVARLGAGPLPPAAGPGVSLGREVVVPVFGREPRAVVLARVLAIARLRAERVPGGVRLLALAPRSPAEGGSP